ncbi:regulatory LuxR family protein [Kribbella voronezhensis]|uniref:Regulatory LuxR family protein n=1 Tax=Kribbella voronezhensis TaxID=2512212 RepID=A0A4R7T7X5_9ACTN|nr:regulatory LuxR family protein [Kribbella voronezhensis]
MLDPALTLAVLERLRNPVEAEDPVYASLTEQERRILDLIAEGKTNRQIAETMFLAEKTVKNYVSGLLPQAQHGTPYRGRRVRDRANQEAPRALRTQIFLVTPQAG